MLIEYLGSVPNPRLVPKRGLGRLVITYLCPYVNGLVRFCSSLVLIVDSRAPVKVDLLMSSLESKAGVLSPFSSVMRGTLL